MSLFSPQITKTPFFQEDSGYSESVQDDSARQASRL